jgi:hypothetical protein
VGRDAIYGAMEAEYNICLRLTTAIVSTITNPGVASCTSCAVMNCAEPANTMEDIICASARDNPAFNASAP